MKYKDAIIEAMDMLASDRRVIFVGQSVAYPGHVMYSTISQIDISRRLEFIVAEDIQLGYCQGLALMGRLPISIFPRIDFLLCAMNQLVNHLDKWEEMSHGEFNPKVIIRTMVGSKSPLNPGPQHSQDHTEALKLLCPNIDLYKLDSAKKILPAYTQAISSSRSSILVEYGDLYG